jgi:hypothetical protein
MKLAYVWRDSLEAGGAPLPIGARGDGSRAEGQTLRPSEVERVWLATIERLEVDAQRRGDGDGAPAGAGLGFHGAGPRVPGALHSQDTASQVEVPAPEGLELPESKAAVHGRRPDRSVARRERGEELHGLSGCGNPVPRCALARQLEAVGRVDRDVAAYERPPADGPERQEGVPDGRRARAALDQVVDEALDVSATNSASL